jgi:hypothetical protein
MLNNNFNYPLEKPTVEGTYEDSGSFGTAPKNASKDLSRRQLFTSFHQSSSPDYKGGARLYSLDSLEEG